MQEEEEELLVDEQQEPETAGLFEHFSITVDKGQGLLRIDKFLFDKLEHTSRARIQAAADRGYVLVNDRAVKSAYRVKPLDRVQLMLPYEPRESEIIAEDIPLDILYEDNDLLVVNKPAGMVVHPGHGNYTGTLVNALAFRFQGVPMFDDRTDIRAGLVHRIDKNTSGILVVAKHVRAHAGLATQFFHHTIHRRYHALVWGDVKDDQGTVVGAIGRNPKDRLQMTVLADDDPNGKHAVTHYKVLERFGYATLIECVLETGRTHQIRVHMKHIGHTLLGDERYGGDKILRGTTSGSYRKFVEHYFELMPRHALHAVSLGFVQPMTGEALEFESDYPSDFAAGLAKWQGHGPF